ncbi:hypothetical protein [Streptomyces viridochromogenes]|nr:hypothetical protein [Streptomyces viridochromogenes]
MQLDPATAPERRDTDTDTDSYFVGSTQCAAAFDTDRGRNSAR